MSSELPTARKKALRTLELLIAPSLLVIMLLSVVATFIMDQAELRRWLEKHEIVIDGVGILECLLLALWMGLGGQNSKLWNWLPPFCLFPKTLWVKWLVVLALIAGTLMGIFAAPRGA